MTVDSIQHSFSLPSPETDYGDFTAEEEELLGAILSQYNTQRPEIGHVVVHTFGSGSIKNSLHASSSSVPRSSQRSFASVSTLEDLVQSGAFPREVQLTVPVHPEPRHSAPTVNSIPLNSTHTDLSASNHASSGPQPQIPASRPAHDPSISPLSRFRAQKPLSVTDLISPAWCELQYSFSLQHHGRKRRTPAMRAGSAVHQKLEDEVHATFSVRVMSKEDAWGLRMWNVIQGARTLRETGMTRELEIWGVVDGQVVNGVIDEVGYKCPDEELEAEGRMAGRGINVAAGQGGGREQGQRSMQDFFRGRIGGNSSEETGSSAGQAPKDSFSRDELRVYLTDVKTRTIRSVPKGSAFRPTAMQLMLYHKLLSELISTTSPFNPQLLWDRYGIDPDVPFTDAFLGQFADDAQSDTDSLPDTVYTASSTLPENDYRSSVTSAPSATQSTEPTALTSSLTTLSSVLHKNHTPRALFTHMQAELRQATPEGLGGVLCAEYRTQNSGARGVDDKGDGSDGDGGGGEVLGSRCFLYDEVTLQQYLVQTMEWWRGQREAKGVAVEDAWKCRVCEFAEGCSWRKEKVDEAVRRYREKGKKG